MKKTGVSVEMREIPLEQVDWTFLNGGSARYRYDTIARMRESIEQVAKVTDIMGGLLEPIGVAFRPQNERPYEVIYGATRAVVQAKRGMKTVMALVYTGLTEGQVHALRFIENEHRSPVRSDVLKRTIDDFVYSTLEG